MQYVKEQPSKKARHSLRILSVQRVETKLMLSAAPRIGIESAERVCAFFSFNRVCTRLRYFFLSFCFYLLFFSSSFPFFFFSHFFPRSSCFVPTLALFFLPFIQVRFLKYDSPTLYYTYWNDAYSFYF